jgi:hypothetical protein
MTQWSRIGDITIGVGSHGAPCCPHVLIGIRITGSHDTYVNNLPGSRAMIDLAIHYTCPHCPVNMCMTGSPDVYTNNLPDHRVGDMVNDFCGSSVTVTGSPDTVDNG